MEQQAQSFNLNDLSADDIQAIMTGLNELPAKVVRATMNKIEGQIIQQLQPPPAPSKAAAD